MPVYLLFLILLFINATGSADTKCTVDDVIERVCRPTHTSLNGSCTPASSRDDSGFRMSRGSFSGILSEKGITITDQGYKRFLDSFDRVKTAYLKLAEQTTPTARAYMVKKLDTYLSPPNKEQLNSNYFISVLEGPGASYSPRDYKIRVSPVILNSVELSQYELDMIVAHEMGHFLDPGVNGANFKEQSKWRQDNYGVEVQKCFELNFKDLPNEPNLENFADWMASQVASHLTSHKSSDIQRERIRSFPYFFCPETKLYDLSIAAIYKMANFLGSHLSDRQRIVTLMQDPLMLQGIGCAPSIVHKDGVTTRSSCHLSSLKSN